MSNYTHYALYLTIITHLTRVYDHSCLLVYIQVSIEPFLFSFSFLFNFRRISIITYVLRYALCGSIKWRSY